MKENFINLVNTYCVNVSLFIVVALIVSIIVMIAYKHYKSFIGMLIIMTAWIGCMIYAVGGDITIFFFILAPLIGFRAYRAYLLCQPDGEYEKKLEKKRKLEQLNNEPLKYKVWLIVIAIMLITRVSEAQVGRDHILTPIGIRSSVTMELLDNIATVVVGFPYATHWAEDSNSGFGIPRYYNDDYGKRWRYWKYPETLLAMYVEDGVVVYYCQTFNNNKEINKFLKYLQGDIYSTGFVDNEDNPDKIVTYFVENLKGDLISISINFVEHSIFMALQKDMR